MAKQNFLSGGYYGKLGATVGQRWKNIRTIRTYVIPENPRTPIQQANRGFFGQAVPFAQKGMAMNKGSPAWDTTSNTEWAQKMSVAKFALEAGLQDVACVPIVPRNFTSSYTVTALKIEEISANNAVVFQMTGTFPSGAKSYSLMIYFADGSRQGEYLLLSGQTTADNPDRLVCPCHDTTSFSTAKLFAVIVSKDDLLADTVTYSARLEVQQEEKPAFTQTMTVTSVTSNNNGSFHITAQMGVYGSDLVGNFDVYNPIAEGTKKLKAAVKTAGNEDGAAAVSLNNDTFLLTNKSFNTVTGVYEFDILDTTYTQIQLYNIDRIAFFFSWENAYNSETSMSSGSGGMTATGFPTYTQPEADIGFTFDSGSPFVQGELDEQSSTNVGGEMTPKNDLTKEIIDQTSSGYFMTPLNSAAVGSLTLTSGQALNWAPDTRYRAFYLYTSGKGEFDFEIEGGIEESGQVASARGINFEVNLTLEANSTKRVGGYNNACRWTPIPTISFNTSWTVV